MTDLPHNDGQHSLRDRGSRMRKEIRSATFLNEVFGLLQENGEHLDTIRFRPSTGIE